jgi:hypothetical protein
MEQVNGWLNPPAKDASEVPLEESPFEQHWAALHNHEIWGTGPSGIYDNPPVGAQTGGALKQQQ